MPNNTYNNAFIIRDNLSDVGFNSQSPYWISPDIICQQQNSLTIGAAISNYGNDSLNLPFINGSPNFFYIRAMNTTGSPATGTVSLWYSPSSLFLSPQSWTSINLPAASETLFDNTGSSTITPEELGMVQTPFPFSGVPSGGHFCLIAVASTNGIPFPLPTKFSSNAAMALWVQANPNVSQRNLSFVAAPANQTTLTAMLGNNNPVPASFIITVTPMQGGANYPAGTTVSVIINDNRLPVSPYNPAPQPWSPAGVSFIGLTVPANITGTTGNPLMAITATITLPAGSTFAGTGQVGITYYQVPTEPSEDETELAATKEYKIPSCEKAGRIDTLTLIEVGICTFNFA